MSAAAAEPRARTGGAEGAVLHIAIARKLAWHLGVCAFCRSRETGPGCDEGEALVEETLSTSEGKRWAP